MDDIKKELVSDCKPIQINGRSMGIGKLGQPDITFVKKFRWTLSASNGLDEHWIKAVNFDFVSNMIHFKAFEIYEKDSSDISLHHWLSQGYKDSTMEFTTYDGCGKALYLYRLSKLTIVSDKISFDYKDSGEAIRKVSVAYGKFERHKAEPQKKQPHNAQKTVPKKGFQWSIAIDSGKEHCVKLTTRPQLNVEESEINFLNAKTWIPGKASWESLHVTISKESEKELLPMLVNWERGTPVTLGLYPRFYQIGNLLETWSLEGAWVESLKIEDGQYVVEFRYSGVKYKNNEQARKSQD